MHGAAQTNNSNIYIYTIPYYNNNLGNTVHVLINSTSYVRP